jgi:hypothetical protein
LVEKENFYLIEMRFFKISSSSIFTSTDLICRQSNRLSKIPKETIVVCEKNPKQQQPEITIEIIRVGIST